MGLSPVGPVSSPDENSPRGIPAPAPAWLEEWASGESRHQHLEAAGLFLEAHPGLDFRMLPGDMAPKFLILQREA